MILDEIQNIIPELENKKRFHKIKGEKDLWFYDSFSHGLYSADCDLIEKISKDNDSKNFLNLSLEEGMKLLGFCKAVRKFNEDEVLPLSPESKCSVMINTSNRCNLNCSYCYRDKSNPSVSNLQTVKKTLDYVTKRYKPEASEYVISYSMTSESSLDLPLLKQIADEYICYENYQFKETDFIEDRFKDFYTYLKRDLSYISNLPFPKEDKTEVTKYLNALLGIRNLFELLNMSESMFKENDRSEVNKRNILAKWRLYRLNRWGLEIKYDRFIYKRQIPFVTFWFMSNGTCASKEFISFVKSCDINPLWISIDGPKEVHDYNRKFNGEINSYEKIVNNIKIFHQNGINLKASVVLTSKYPKPLSIIKHLLSLGFNQISMTPVRPGYECSFNDKNVNQLLAGYDEVFEELENTSIRKDFSLFYLLKEDMILASFFSFLNRVKIVRRCSFDDQIVVNSKGEIYPCLYFTDNKDFCYGNIEDGIDYRKINHNILVGQRGTCNECWARYLCGGTCFYGSYKTNGDYINIDSIECIIKKYLAEKCLKLIIFLREHNIAIENLV